MAVTVGAAAPSEQAGLSTSLYPRLLQAKSMARQVLVQGEGGGYWTDSQSKLSASSNPENMRTNSSAPKRIGIQGVLELTPPAIGQAAVKCEA